MILKVFFLEVQSLESEKPPLYLSWGGPVLDFFFRPPKKNSWCGPKTPPLLFPQTLRIQVCPKKI